ncbi:hypothetical protein KEM09_15650 [Carboxylicivirga mesophila]|uniref:DUF4842 domain-containing protein n=1 Tax=Carboxylicivirga mesophila TaxID=1166478 RepID=A0ABS5KDG3_9BACT|nr:hypothetical protein [Carboxylicivirga mesophila]MBS2212852.1 hypothetical protein [Carboxylicivirga mesophila]
MRKIVVVIATLVLVLGACKENVSSPVENSAEFSIGISEADFVTLKSAPLGVEDYIPTCNESLSLDYAKVTFDIGKGDETVTIPIFKVAGKYVTQPVKINMETAESIQVTISEFLVYNMGDDGEIDEDLSLDISDDVLVKATPHGVFGGSNNSAYFQFINPNNGLRTITLNKFTKEEIVIDVLCYDDLVYDNFGFVWFNINAITVRSQCWFGDICVADKTLFEGSVYEQQQNGLQIDMPAIMKIDVLRFIGNGLGDYGPDMNWEFLYSYNNMGTFGNGGENGEGDCMTIAWPDNDDIDELFRFDLYVYLPDINKQFDYRFQNSYSFYNNEAPNTGDDGVVDFVIGSCFSEPFIIIIPPDNDGCTLTQGYWKNHTGDGPGNQTNAWQGATQPDTPFNATQTYLEVLETSAAGGNPYYILAHQYIAALLNVENGPVDLNNWPDVKEAFDNAAELFDNDGVDDVVPEQTFTEQQKSDMVNWSTVLDLFNNGILGSGHCD